MPNPYEREKDIYGFQTLFREIGYYIKRLEFYEKSLKYFDEAVRKTPTDKRALRGRCVARAKACQYEGALEDIRRALNLDSTDLIFLADKALLTYLSCEFENGMVQNVRLVPRRIKPDHFVMGVMHCRNSIENCIGERGGRPLRDHFKIIRKLAWKKSFEEHKDKDAEPCPTRAKKKQKKIIEKRDLLLLKKTKQDSKEKIKYVDKPEIKDSLHSHISEANLIPKYIQSYPFRPLQRYTTNIDNYIAETYLGAMYLDKLYLKKVYHEPGVQCPNKKSSEQIKRLAKIGYKSVCYNQELLRTRRPFYHIKFQASVSKGALKARQEQELILQQLTIKKEADLILERLQKAVDEKKLLRMKDYVGKLRKYCDSKSKRLLPNKNDYIKEIFRLVSQGYFDLNRLNDKQYAWDQEKRIHIALALPISREPSTDSVIDEYQDDFANRKQQIDLFERRLAITENSDEICYCLFEITRNNLELNKWEMARVYGKKGLAESQRRNNTQWIVNIAMLLARVDICLQNKIDAKEDVVIALKAVQHLEDDTAKKYLEKCLEVIDKVEFDDQFGPQVLEQRQNKILDLMGSAKMKDELSHLFRMMKSLPASRRMIVMPGIKSDDAPTRGRSRMTVTPAASKDIAVPKSVVPPKKSQQYATKSVSFTKSQAPPEKSQKK